MPPRSLLRFSVVLTSKPTATAATAATAGYYICRKRSGAGAVRWRVAACDIACSQDWQSQLTPPSNNERAKSVERTRFSDIPPISLY